MNTQYFFSTRQDGDMRKAQFQKQFAKKHAITTPVVLAQQVHGTNIAIVTTNEQNTIIEAVDGLVTTESLALGIRTADCVPLICIDTHNGVIGIVHAGWRGVIGNIAANVIQTMQRVGAQKEMIQCVCGPHIQACCYTVEFERATAFRQAYGIDVVTMTRQGIFLDLTATLTKQLQSLGISSVTSSHPCTRCSEEYFSYRRDSKETFGEQLSVVTLQ